ncbi:MAG: bifunctional DNA-formamidopyrimidine glycosylase/DNA-(apurinic or apyrimidinic site) lyase [Woeseiaceae bacterium]|nr:bifunctional DNA-formamidopyrimidine glycosylase/DNA-(apurinic or apyrimidinic site) lyase [Woeseiaceae bacterium]
MPELPEVETSRRGIAPWLEGMRVAHVVVRERRLRWPVPVEVDRLLPGEIIHSIRRRAKYLLFDTNAGILLLHLGMSGSVRIIEHSEPAAKHDHVDIVIEDGKALRFRDPRRFGSMLWTSDASKHPLLRDLGPEPLGEEFDGNYIWRAARGRRTSIKQFIMDGNVVVGVGNIYASESLFLAGIHPMRRADRVALPRMQLLATSIRSVLEQAIKAGGTTLRDFHGGDGEPGYFRQQLEVYGREGEPCRRCKSPIVAVVLGQRSSFYCRRCQR